MQIKNCKFALLCLKIFIDVQTCIWYGTLSTVMIKKFIMLHTFRNISSCVWPHWEWFLLVFPSLSLLTLLQMSPSHPLPCLPPPSLWAPHSGHHHTVVCVCGWCTYGVGQNQVYSCEYIKEFILYCYLLVVFSIWAYFCPTLCVLWLSPPPSSIESHPPPSPLTTVSLFPGPRGYYAKWNKPVGERQIP